MRVWVLRRSQVFARLALVVLLLAIFPLWRLGTAGWSAVRAHAAMGSLQGRIIVVDPGHGGDDPGAIGPNRLLEKNLVLAMSLRLKQRLEESGAQVVLTRDTDTHLPPGDVPFVNNRDLQYRVDVTNRSNADIMVSIHANKFDGPQWSGAQVWYDLRGAPESKDLAIAITQALRRHTSTERWIQTGQFYITHYVRIPAALVEVGFLSNPGEAALLQTSAYQDKVVSAIAEGIAQFMSGAQNQLHGPPLPPRRR